MGDPPFYFWRSDGPLPIFFFGRTFHPVRLRLGFWVPGMKTDNGADTRTPLKHTRHTCDSLE